MARSVMMMMAGLAAAAMLQTAAAQTLYKSTLPDGRVVYGDRPAPGAMKVEESRPDTSKGGLGGTAGREQEAVKELEKARLQREGQDDKVRNAEKALRDAEAAFAAGKEPQPGERIGAAGGASRLNESYFERQRKLEEAITRARQELDQVRSGR